MQAGSARGAAGASQDSSGPRHPAGLAASRVHFLNDALFIET